MSRRRGPDGAPSAARRSFLPIPRPSPASRSAPRSWCTRAPWTTPIRWPSRPMRCPTCSSTRSRRLNRNYDHNAVAVSSSSRERRESVMFHCTLKVCCFAVMAAAGAHIAAAAHWVKGYVVAFYEPAFRYGGRADYSRGTEVEPGVDCPHGSTIHFALPAQVAKSLSLVPWRTTKEVQALANPPADGLERNVAGVYFHTWRAASAYRGYNRDIETYINPFAAEDPGQPQVTSRIGEGFNLDGKIKPDDFVSPEGEKGIDNELYRAWGCDAPWRGENGNGTLVLRSNDKMLEGLYTIVIRISGNKDAMNDDNATLEVGYSPDQIMKDARGNVGIDYSYRILKSEQYTKLKARVKDGV